jgi:hypothetical protein
MYFYLEDYMRAEAEFTHFCTYVRCVSVVCRVSCGGRIANFIASDDAAACTLMLDAVRNVDPEALQVTVKGQIFGYLDNEARS